MQQRLGGKAWASELSWGKKSPQSGTDYHAAWSKPVTSFHASKCHVFEKKK